MASRTDIVLDDKALEPKIAPLFTLEERAEWERRKADARLKRSTDRSIEHYYREKAVDDMWLVARCQKVHARPEPYLNALICLIGSRGTKGYTGLEDVYTDDMEQMWPPFDSPEARWWVDKILEGLAHMPRSYAKSAAMRYFKATGKQKSLDKPGVGLLSVENGWKSLEVDVILRVLYDYELGKPLLNAGGLDPYSAETREAAEEAWEEGRDVNRFAMAHGEYDVAFINTLRGLLASRGLTQPVLKCNPKKPPKPRKAKAWAIGDTVTARYVPDIPTGTILKKGTCRSWRLEDGKEYVWCGKEQNSYVLEDPSKRRTEYGRFRAVTTRDMEGMVIERLPARTQ
jgi:hypothetical protein